MRLKYNGMALGFIYEKGKGVEDGQNKSGNKNERL